VFTIVRRNIDRDSKALIGKFISQRERPALIVMVSIFRYFAAVLALMTGVSLLFSRGEAF
jgi:hypothetical protein